MVSSFSVVVEPSSVDTPNVENSPFRARIDEVVMVE